MGVKDMASDLRETAFSIQNFMWEGKPHKSDPKEHTIDEYREFLESIRRSHWGTWNSCAEEYGWK